jgi:hypothetical protein
MVGAGPMLRDTPLPYAIPAGLCASRSPTRCPQDHAHSPASLHGPVDRGVGRGCLAAVKAAVARTDEVGRSTV